MAGQRVFRRAVRGHVGAEPAGQAGLRRIRSKKIGRLFGIRPKGSAKFLLEEIWLSNGAVEIRKSTRLSLRSIFHSLFTVLYDQTFLFGIISFVGATRWVAHSLRARHRLAPTVIFPDSPHPPFAT